LKASRSKGGSICFRSEVASWLRSANDVSVYWTALLRLLRKAWLCGNMLRVATVCDGWMYVLTSEICVSVVE